MLSSGATAFDSLPQWDKPTSATPTPLTDAQIQARYSAAAGRYNQGEVQIAATENASCDATSATVSLTACQTALSSQRQLTIAYDNALRAIPLTGSAATDVTRLLGEDAALLRLGELKHGRRVGKIRIALEAILGDHPDLAFGNAAPLLQ